MREHSGAQPAPLKSLPLTREANGHEVGPRGQTHGHSKERQWDLLHHLQAASMRLWGRGPLALRPVPPQPWVPQAPRTMAECTCLLLAEAVEGHLRVHAEARTHQQRRVPGTEGGERGWQAAGNLWGHSAGWRAGALRPRGRQDYLCEAGRWEAQPVHELTVVPQPVGGPHADSLVPAGGQP